jgi:hypothetical protein
VIHTVSLRRRWAGIDFGFAKRMSG